MNNDITQVTARVQTFLDVCGIPNEPIAAIWRRDAAGRPMRSSGMVYLLASDIQLLLNALADIDELDRRDT